MKFRVLLLSALLWLLCLNVGGQTFQDLAPSFNITTGYGLPSFEGGGGISFVDWNGDGWDDLTFATESGRNIEFYLNSEGTLSLMSSPPVTLECETKSVIWVDYDGDGDKDLFATCYADQNYLFLNTGGVFTDHTSNAQLPTTASGTYGANFADYDKDGDLDLYITNYGTIDDLPDIGELNQFYANNGDGTFSDITDGTGTANGIKQSFCSAFFDYDNDGWEDLYVVNDRTFYPNALYKNNGNGTFTDVSMASNSDVAIFAMNAGIGDYDENGFQDIYVTNAGPSASLHNNGNNTFTDEAGTNGTIFNRVGWAGVFFDCDNDIDLDLYVCSMNANYSEPNALYINNGTGLFTEPYYETGGLQGKDTMQSYSTVTGDLDNDGWCDIALSNGNGYNFVVWQNLGAFDNPGNPNNWVRLQLVGINSNPEAYGARVEFWKNGASFLRSKLNHNGYLSQNSDIVMQGMGGLTSWDSVKVYWPFPNSVDVVDGDDINVNGLTTIIEGSGAILPLTFVNVSAHLNTKRTASINWKISDAYNVDHFKILRSNTTLDFQSIGEVSIENPIELEGFYTWEDKDIVDGYEYFYLIHGIDRDGRVTKSNIVSLSVPKSVLANKLHIAQNVFQSSAVNLNLKYLSNHNARVKVRSSTISGIEVFEGSFDARVGNNEWEIDLSDHPSGLFHLFITDLSSNEVIVKRYVVL